MSEAKPILSRWFPDGQKLYSILLTVLPSLMARGGIRARWNISTEVMDNVVLAAHLMSVWHLPSPTAKGSYSRRY